MNISFSYPDYLFLFIPVLLLLVFFYVSGFKNIDFSGLEDLKKIYKWNSFIYKIKYIILFLSVCFFILALANPLITYEKKTYNKLQLHFIMDLSYSMITNDLNWIPRYNVMLDWINSFNDWNFTIFAGWVKKIDFINLEEINDEYIKELNLSNDWSSLWDAILFSSKYLDTESTNIFFVLSDGVVNEGKNIIDSLVYLKNIGVQISTFAIWGDDITEVFVDNWFWDMISKKVELVDEITLKKIALETNWKFFRIYDSEKLNNAIDSIIKENSFTVIKNNFFIANLLYIISFIIFMFYFLIGFKSK